MAEFQSLLGEHCRSNHSHNYLHLQLRSINVALIIVVIPNTVASVLEQKVEYECMKYVGLPVVCSHFSSLGVRDVALSKSLNTDYLSQLFIKGAAQELDCGWRCVFYSFHVTNSVGIDAVKFTFEDVHFIVYSHKPCLTAQHHVLHLTADLTARVMNDDLPMEARDMLIYKRGWGYWCLWVQSSLVVVFCRSYLCSRVVVSRYGVETTAELWILQKLDYIQLLAVRASISAVAKSIRELLEKVQTSVKNLEEKFRTNSRSVRDISLEDIDSLVVNAALLDVRTWNSVKRIGKDAIVSMTKMGISPKVHHVVLVSWLFLHPQEKIKFAFR